MSIWIDVDTAITIPVNKMPLVSSADGFTIDETIAYNESGMDLNWNFVTTAGVMTQTNVVPTTSGDYDWTHIGNGIYKIEMTASGGASANNDTEGFGWFSGKADAILPFSGPMIGFRAAALNNTLVDGGDLVENIADAVWDEILSGASHNTPNSAGRRLRQLSITVVREEVAQGGTANSITLDSEASAIDDWYLGALISLSENTGAEQCATIVSYNGTTKVAIIGGTWITNPDDTTRFRIACFSHVEHIHHGLAQAGAAGSITLPADASAVDDYYNDQLMHIVSGAGEAQIRLITAYDGSSKVATITPNWATNPNDTSVYHICPSGRTNVDAIFDEVVESTTTFRQMLRGVISVLMGKSAGGGTVTLTFRDLADLKDRITALVNAKGDRKEITLDLT